MQDKKDYALYDKLDNLIMIGRIGDIARYLNRSKRGIQLSISQYKKRHGQSKPDYVLLRVDGTTKKLYVIGDDEDD